MLKICISSVFLRSYVLKGNKIIKFLEKNTAHFSAMPLVLSIDINNVLSGRSVKRLYHALIAETKIQK